MLKNTVVLCVLLLALAGCSGTPSKEQVRASIRPLIPGNFEVLEVKQLPEVAGLVQVVLQAQQQPVVLYMDKKLKYIFSGSLISMEKKVNLTVLTLQKYRGQAGRH